MPIKTPDLSGSIDLKGGRIDDIVLTKYKETTQPNSPNVVLLEPAGAKLAYFAEFGWVATDKSSPPLPNRDTLWTASGPGSLTPQTPVELTWDDGQGLIFHRTISVDDHYMFTVKDTVDNKGSVPVSMQPYGRIFRLGLPETSGFAVLHEGLIGTLSSDASPGLKEVSYAELLKDAAANEKANKPAAGDKSYPGVKDGWLGFTDKYWAAVMVPPTGVTYDAHFYGYKAVPGQQDEGFQADDLLPTVSVAPGASQSVEQRLFAGAKVVDLLNAYADQGIKRFDMMIDWGWSAVIAKPMFWLIDHLNKLTSRFTVNSMGWAILLVTVLFKGLFFPLANRSYESMAKMRKMQPEMEKIKEQFKDDRPRQQQEMMKLYQTHKINPASGCLPMVLQFPVFFALYKVLVLTIDMRHAPFIGWVHDLSAPDPSNIFNLFGLLPFDPTQLPVLGTYLHIGFWPLLMGITMWMTMKLSPQQGDPTQQQIMNWMPVIMTFSMARFPAGLCLYWAWSNLLSLMQQYYIMHKNGAEIHLRKNLGIEPWIARLKGVK